MDKGEIITLSKILVKEDYPSKTGMKLVKIMEKIPVEKWDLEMTIIFVRAVNSFMGSKSNKYDFEDLYDILDNKRNEGVNDYDWNSMIANVLFNMQDEECVHYMKQAIKIAGGNPEINYNEVISTAQIKIEENNAEELTDEEYLALYIRETTDLID